MDKQEHVLSDFPFFLQKGGIFAVPCLHYTMEMAAAVRQAFAALKPDCVAVELPETLQLPFLHGASRLPDLSVVATSNEKGSSLYYLVEPCDAAFEGLRSALESQIPAYCIDLEVGNYPQFQEGFPDPYAMQRIGLKKYYEAYQQEVLTKKPPRSSLDHQRELYMAKRLKELSFQYDRILFIGGMFHVEKVLSFIDHSSFPSFSTSPQVSYQLCTLTEEASREVMGECGWITLSYEQARDPSLPQPFPPDRQKLLYQLFKEAIPPYIKQTGHAFPGYHLRNIMKFSRNYALLTGHLLPDMFQLLSAAKGCVDHNYAYEVWELATAYPHLRNIEGLPELALTAEEVWGGRKWIRFHLREKGKKSSFSQRKRRKDRLPFRFSPPSPFTMCSYPPEDLIVENFGNFLQKKGVQLATEEGARTVPFTTSLGEGIDTKETIRHWAEKTLYVKMGGRPSGGVGSVVVIFDEDRPEEGHDYEEKYPWKMTWLGEHEQESDMALYATSIEKKVVGPGISRCEYGGFMMSYPPRRMWDVWGDPDYQECRTKAEVLLVAAIDYAVKPLVVYVAATPPRSALKSYAKRFGKKLLYLPMGQLSPLTLQKLRVFHVLDSHSRRTNANEYIF